MLNTLNTILVNPSFAMWKKMFANYSETKHFKYNSR